MYFPIVFGPTENNASRSADPEYPTLESNMTTEEDRMIRRGDIANRNFARLVVGRSSLYLRHMLLFAT